MLRPWLRGARAPAWLSSWRTAILATIAVFVMQPAIPAQAQVLHLKGNRANGSGAIVGIDLPREGVKKHFLVLTAYHVMKNNVVTVDGQPVTLLAHDEKTDLALAKVADIDYPGYFIANKRIPTTGKAILYGYPGGGYSKQHCEVDESGDLTCKVQAGGSGGPLVKGHYFLVGVLVRYHGVATRAQIESFLQTTDYAWLLQIANGYEHMYIAD